MKNIQLSIAGYIFQLVFHETEYHQAQGLFFLQLLKSYKGFILPTTNKKIDFTIHFIQNNQSEVLKFKEKNYIEYYKLTGKNNSIFSFYSISLEQFTQLIRYALFYLLDKSSGFFLHGAVSVKNNGAYLFIGPSGRGKSTCIRLLRKAYIPFADDSFIIRKVNSNFYCFQTPFLDKQTWIKKNYCGFPIQKIYILEQSLYTSSELMDSSEAKEIILSELIANQTNISTSLRALMFFLKNKLVIYKLRFSLNGRGLVKELGTT
ncbi:MAG: hypothetical protein WA061_01335 [Microgenomates group bacterium]